MSSISLKNFLDGRSLFSEIANVELFEFLADDLDVLDSLLIINYGSKTMFVPMVDCSLTIIAKMIVVKHGKQWRELLDAEVLKLGLGTTRELTETVNDLETRTNTRNEVNTVSGFNSVELLNDTGATISGEDGLTGNKTRTLTDKTIDDLKVYNLLSNDSKTSIIETVLRDVNGFLTLSIY